jgi:hypothetical protein
MMKRYIIITFIAYLLWWVLQTLLSKHIVDLAIINKNILYIIFFNIAVYLMVGLIIGWFSKEKGWLLGFVFSIIIISTSIVILLNMDFFATDIEKIGKWDAIKRNIFSHLTFIAISGSVLGGYLGNLLRKKWEKKKVK